MGSYRRNRYNVCPRTSAHFGGVLAAVSTGKAATMHKIFVFALLLVFGLSTPAMAQRRILPGRPPLRQAVPAAMPVATPPVAAPKSPRSRRSARWSMA